VNCEGEESDESKGRVIKGTGSNEQEEKGEMNRNGTESGTKKQAVETKNQRIETERQRKNH